MLKYCVAYDLEIGQSYELIERRHNKEGCIHIGSLWSGHAPQNATSARVP